MDVTISIDTFSDLDDNCWSGARETLSDIARADKEEELMEHLEIVFEYETPSLTEVNDYLWHDRSSVYEAVGLDENGELKEDFEEFPDGEVNVAYLDWLENTGVEDFIDTNLNSTCVEVELAKKLEGTNTLYMELSTDLNADSNCLSLTEAYYNSYEDTVLNKKFKDETLEISAGIDVSGYHYWIVEHDEMPQVSITVTSKGRLLETDMDRIVDFINELTSELNEVLEENEAYIEADEH